MNETVIGSHNAEDQKNVIISKQIFQRFPIALA